MARLRLGVIGAGSWTVRSHLPNLMRHRDEVDFVIVNRRSPAELARIQSDFDFKAASTDWRDVLGEQPDIVVVGSPASLHWEQCKAALEAGAHVLCEKPFTIDPVHAWDLAETARRTDKALIIAYGWNYRPLVLKARQWMDEDGGVGETEHVALYMDSAVRLLLSGTGSYPSAAPGYPPQAETWARPETSGGGYGQAQLSHLLGIALWLTGLRGEEVSAFMSSPAGSKNELHDAMVIRYTNGAIGTASGASSHLGVTRNRCSVAVRLVGSRGQLHLDLSEDFLWRYRVDGGEALAPLEVGAGEYDCIGPIDALVAAGAGRPLDNNSPAELGARAVEILEAAYRSADSGSTARIRTLTWPTTGD